MKTGTAPSAFSSPVRFLVLRCFLWLSLASSGYAEAFRNYPLDSEPLWEMTPGSQWAFGVPQGSGGSQYGNPDPKAGHTGANVYGVNLNGDYSLTVGGPWYHTADPIDCRRRANVHLNFRRWLNTDYQSYVYVRWGYQIAADAYAYSGWYLDDIRFEGDYRSVYNQTQGLGHANIQGALNTAVNGDVIVVADGIYAGTGVAGF